MNRALLSLALVLAFCGCRTLNTDSPNLLAIDPEGRLFGAGDPTPCGNVCEKHLDSIFNGILDHKLRGLTNILIFVQGGLNDIESGINRAKTLSSTIMSDTNRPAYPIFVAWDASFS